MKVLFGADLKVDIKYPSRFSEDSILGNILGLPQPTSNPFFFQARTAPKRKQISKVADVTKASFNPPSPR